MTCEPCAWPACGELEHGLAARLCREHREAWRDLQDAAEELARLGDYWHACLRDGRLPAGVDAGVDRARQALQVILSIPSVAS